MLCLVSRRCVLSRHSLYNIKLFRSSSLCALYYFGLALSNVALTCLSTLSTPCCWSWYWRCFLWSWYVESGYPIVFSSFVVVRLNFLQNDWSQCSKTRILFTEENLSLLYFFKTIRLALASLAMIWLIIPINTWSSRYWLSTRKGPGVILSESF